MLAFYMDMAPMELPKACDAFYRAVYGTSVDAQATEEFERRKTAEKKAFAD